MLDLEPRSQLVGILVNLNAVPCKSVMEQFRPHGDCPHPPLRASTTWSSTGKAEIGFEIGNPIGR